MQDKDRGEPHSAPPLLTTKIEEIVGAAALALSFLITFANVVVRYVTNVSFAFTEEISVFLLVFITFWGTARAIAHDRHIQMDAVIKTLSTAKQLAFKLFAALLGIGLFSSVLWYGAMLAYNDWRWDNQSAALGLPIWLYTVWVPLISALIIFRFAERIWRFIAGFRR